MTPTRVLRVDPRVPSATALGAAADVIAQKGVVAFPTETFYGLGAAALEPESVRRIFEIKGRPESKPLLVLVDSIGMAESLVEEIPSHAWALIDRHWPGPLTLVLRARPGVPAGVTAGTGTVGIRMSSHPVAIGLVRAAGTPVTAPSANPSGGAPPTSAERVLANFDGAIDLMLDGGPTAGGPASTVVDLTVDPPQVLRPGAVAL